MNETLAVCNFVRFKNIRNILIWYDTTTLGGGGTVVWAATRHNPTETNCSHEINKHATYKEINSQNKLNTIHIFCKNNFTLANEYHPLPLPVRIYLDTCCAAIASRRFAGRGRARGCDPEVAPSCCHVNASCCSHMFSLRVSSPVATQPNPTP